MEEVRFRQASEGGLLVDFGEEIRADRIQRVQRLLGLLDRSPLQGIEELTPSYGSILIEYDPLELNAADVEEHVRFWLERIGHVEMPAPKQIEVPVFYGGEYGPDLAWSAERLGMSVSELVTAHCEQVFSVAFFGFLPGFAYLHGWPAGRALPRMESPRAVVAAGSVGIAGAQCGIYPVDSPGGWRILGRTPLPVLDAARQSFSLFDLGMQVRFYPSNPAAWRTA
jgi:KipI family sensor histidine kinase inhibitor